MSDRETVIEKIHSVFAGNEFPGARFLQDSFEGCEPYDEVGPFEKLEDWRWIDAALESFWLDRARTAPTAQSLGQHMADQESYLSAIRPGIEDGTDKP